MTNEMTQIGAGEDGATGSLRKPVSRKRRSQRGVELIEFGLAMVILGPLLVGGFSNGMNFVKTIQSKQVVRDLANLYIHGTDFSSWDSQQLAIRLASGLNLVPGTTLTGTGQNAATNTGTSGSAMIVVTKLMYIAATTGFNCQAVSPTACNSNKFVFLERIKFGNSTLDTAHPSALGEYTGSGSTYGLSTQGVVPWNTSTTPVTSTYGPLPASGQTLLNAAYTTALGDGQYVYVVEGFFDTTAYQLGNPGATGVYSRFYF